MAKVAWTPRALDDLREIHGFIARDSPCAADVMVDRLIDATDQLEAFPESGRILPEFPALSYRELIVGSYRVVYRPEGNRLWIAAVVHGMRRLERAP